MRVLSMVCAVQGHVGCGVLAWEDSSLSSCLQPDVVLGSDLLYDPVAIPDLVAMLHTLLQPYRQQSDEAGLAGEGLSSPVMILATTRRNEKTLKQFLNAAASAGLCVQDMTNVSQSVRFMYVSKLDTARDRILLHTIKLLS